MTGPGRDDGGAVSRGSALAQSARRHGRLLTLVVVAMVAGCGVGTWWQVERALGGNLPSDVYAFLWPLYACYVVYVWLRLRRGATTLIGRAPRTPDPDPEHGDERADEALAAYNRYLAGKRADAQRRAR